MDAPAPPSIFNALGGAIPSISSGPAVSGNGDQLFDANARFDGITINQGPLLTIPALIVAGVALLFFVTRK